ncbi:4Fe-4S binding protein [Enterovibrio sp. ZSDZ35]|uniref:4Fe-4S binding protein n=1 Tax=Enterovibrio qingdaonensis TaxID=2899818 RepID=A0ABT5QH22_9GAMM|nr:4Fe-4S binding protein [Enterovibrio sp. ZSDZ35]MDD1780282.1 4Fe-4S binding protein [Enterovibrio sp. ZSDZ35]
MKNKKPANRNKNLEKVLSVASVIVLILAWFLGGLRTNNSQTQFFESITNRGEQIVQVSPQLYKVVPQGDNAEQLDALKWISFGSGIGYGGSLTIGGVFMPNGDVQTISLLSSKETSSYFEKVVEDKLPEALLEQNIRKALYVDGVSGATLTSDAYSTALNQAADPVRQQLFSYQLTEKASPLSYFKWLDAAALLFFVAAVWVNQTRSPHKAKMNAVLLAGSTLVFGFHAAALYSASTMGGLIFGSWLTGVANYTPFILLVLSIGYILYYNRNVYCQSLCPFGAVQQCLAKVGKAKASPVRHTFFVWMPRVLLLVTLCMGAYFRNPAGFVYEPFGIAFGMIGGMYLFVLTVMIILTSLIVRRPWCQSLCPINAMTDFIVFNKNWFKQTQNKAKKKNRQPRARKEGSE